MRSCNILEKKNEKQHKIALSSMAFWGAGHTWQQLQNNNRKVIFHLRMLHVTKCDEMRRHKK